MKKLSLFLVLALLICVFAVPALAETNLSVAWWGNQTRNERTQAALDLYAEQNPDVKFDVQMNAWSDYWAALATAAAGNSLPDVIQMDYAYLLQYIGNGLLEDLTPYIESGSLNVSNVNAGILASGSVDGGVYGICMGVNAPALAYNKTLLDQYGIAVKDNMTIDEFVALCKDVYAQTGYKTNIGYGGNGIGMLQYLLRGLGRTPIYADGKLNLSQEDAAYFFGLYEQGITEGWHLGSEVFAEINASAVEQDPMVYGFDPANMSWCSFIWSNQMTAMQAAAPEGMDVGITSWPSPDAAKSNFLKPAMFISAPSQGSKQDEAVKVIDYILNSTDCNGILLGERGIPASSVVAAAIAPLLDSVNQKVVAYINNVVSPNCSAVPSPDPVGASEVSTLMKEVQEQLCYGAINAADAASYFIQEGSAAMNR